MERPIQQLQAWESLVTLYTLRSGVAATVTLAVAVGCADLPIFGTAESAPAREISPLAAFLADARPGDSTFVTDPDTGRRLSVTAKRTYFAASGRTCRRYDLANAQSGAHLPSGLACKNGDGEWNLHKLIANPDDVSAPQ